MWLQVRMMKPGADKDVPLTTGTSPKDGTNNPLEKETMP